MIGANFGTHQHTCCAMIRIAEGIVRDQVPHLFGPYNCVVCKSQFLTTNEYLGKVARCIFHRKREAGECCVCYDHHSQCVRLSCGHLACAQCAEQWFAQTMGNDLCPSCPICRKAFPQIEMNTRNGRWSKG